jgi:hypothetical protein
MGNRNPEKLKSRSQRPAEGVPRSVERGSVWVVRQVCRVLWAAGNFNAETRRTQREGAGEREGRNTEMLRSRG